jgi:hypothetical protein
MKRRNFIRNVAAGAAAAATMAPTDLLGEVKTPTNGNRNRPVKTPELPLPYKPPCGNSSHDNLMHPAVLMPFCRQCSIPQVKSREERLLEEAIGKEMARDFNEAIIEALTNV